MAYIGRQLARGENKLFDDISSSFNGSTTTFTLAVSSVATATATPYQLFVSLGGVMQKPNTDFTTAGNQITFTTAPAAGLSCWIMMQGDTIDQAAVADASITPSKISGSNFAFSGDLRLKDADGSHYVGFASPSTVASNKVWTLPAADGSASQYLQTNGSGVLTWSTVSIGGATGIDFNDNVKARWGTGNDLEVFHDGSHSWVQNATGYLYLGNSSGNANHVHIQAKYGEEGIIVHDDAQVELYHDGSKKFETSAAGVSITGALTVSTNATITGDLTVNGTTTTVDSVTLSVKDKNIEMGVVSSPSDTTADGGGITLKGASDKSFNWVNATDAWTSSEHIHLLDNKKLFVGGASGTTDGLEVVHDGSNSILNDTGTGALKLQLGGSTKLEITSGGIDVTGAITVGGSPLSSAPTVDLVADGAIGNNVACNIKSNGKVEAVTEIVAGTNVAATNLGSGVSYTRITYDTEHNLFAMWYVQSGDIKCKVGTPTGSGNTSTITWGSAQNVNTAFGSGVAYMAAEFVTCNNANKHVLGYIANGSSLYAQAVDIASNGTLTIGAQQHVTNSVWSQNVEIANGHESNYQFLLIYVESSSSEVKLRDGSINTGTNAVTLAGENNILAGSGTYRDPIFAFTYRGDRTTVMARKDNYYMRYNTRVAGQNKTTSNLGGSTVTRLTMFYDTPSEKVIAFYIDNGAFKYDTADISTSNAYLTFSGSPTTQLSSNINGFSNFHSPVAYDTVNKKYWFLYSRDTPNQKTFLWGFTVSAAGALTWDASAKEIAAAEIGPLGAHYETSLGNITAFSGTNGYTSYNASSSADTENFLGYSSAAYSDGNTATIKVMGNTSTGLSSLTPGKTYYLQRNGSIALTAQAGFSVIAGTSLTATSLLINPGR